MKDKGGAYYPVDDDYWPHPDGLVVPKFLNP